VVAGDTEKEKKKGNGKYETIDTDRGDYRTPIDN